VATFELLLQMLATAALAMPIIRRCLVVIPWRNLVKAERQICDCEHIDIVALQNITQMKALIEGRIVGLDGKDIGWIALGTLATLGTHLIELIALD
jgi:hypothetical protein